MSLADYITKNNYVVDPETKKHHPIAGEAKILIENICDWVMLQSMDRDDTIETLMCLFDGVLDVNRFELDHYIDMVEAYEACRKDAGAEK